MEYKFKTDKFGFRKESQAYYIMNIHGFKVEIRRIFHEVKDPRLKLLAKTYPFYNAYVELKGMDDKMYEKLPCVTYRKKNWVGVDTAHYYNQDQTELERFISALSQIEAVIETYKRIIARRKK